MCFSMCPTFLVKMDIFLVNVDILMNQLNLLKTRDFLECNDLGDEMEYGNAGEQMVKKIHTGDNVIVNCQTFINKNYQILLSDKGLR